MSALRRLVPLVLLVTVGSVAPPATSAARPTGFAFGRIGGNIRPYTVSIANSGIVHTSGAVEVARKLLSAAQLAALNRVATDTRFITLPKTTNCPGSLPDVASTYVRVAETVVRVHGACVPRYERLLKALKASVRLAAG